jgi:hypothetical protein
MDIIPLHSKIVDWEWFKEPTVLQVFIYCLINAQRKESKIMGHIIERGSFRTTLKDISEATNLSNQQTRTVIEKLKSTNNIGVKTTNKFTIITICNYDNYNDSFQIINKEEVSTSNKQLTNKKGVKATNKKVSFNDSEIYDLKAFADAFPDWSKEQKRYYYDAASSYSDEGNKYINWKSAINNWALRDEHNQRNFFFKKSNYKNEPNTIITGRKDYPDWMED